jgi:hypothetical protein
MVEQFYIFYPIVFPILFVFLDVVDPIVRIVEHYQVKTIIIKKTQTIISFLCFFSFPKRSYQTCTNQILIFITFSFFFRLLNDKNITHERNKSPNEKLVFKNTTITIA